MKQNNVFLLIESFPLIYIYLKYSNSQLRTKFTFPFVLLSHIFLFTLSPFIEFGATKHTPPTVFLLQTYKEAIPVFREQTEFIRKKVINNNK